MGNVIKFTQRPSCQVEGCNNHAMIVKTVNGIPKFRRRNDTGYVCGKHHKDLTAASKGITATEWTNSWHPYRQHRKDYCENVDGRLGYKCTTTIVWHGQLDVDHKDGDPSNNEPDNLQTLCKCCHSYKGWREKDWMTPGRKALGITY